MATNQVENNHPSSPLEEDERSQARALATIYFYFNGDSEEVNGKIWEVVNH